MIEASVSEGIARIVMNSPPVNALSPAFVAEFSAALDLLEAERGWSVLHLSSRAKVFCAGGDLQSMGQWMASGSPSAHMRPYVEAVQKLFLRLEEMPQVTVAEIAGSALGGGLELALACDLRIAARGAKLGLPEVGIGLLPGGGGTQRLTQLCGRATASRLILGAEIVNGTTALDLGLVQWAEPEDELGAKTAAIVKRIAGLSADAIARSKRCIGMALQGDGTGYAEELSSVCWLLEQADTRSRIAAFLSGQRGG